MLADVDSYLRFLDIGPEDGGRWRFGLFMSSDLGSILPPRSRVVLMPLEARGILHAAEHRIALRPGTGVLLEASPEAIEWVSEPRSLATSFLAVLSVAR